MVCQVLVVVPAAAEVPVAVVLVVAALAAPVPAVLEVRGPVALGGPDPWAVCTWAAVGITAPGATVAAVAWAA